MASTKETVQAVIFNGGKVLVVQRTKEESFLPDIWETPGGEVQEGETLRDACKREVLEEVGISVEVKMPYHCSEYVDGNKRRTVCRHYITRTQSKPIVRLSSEHSQYRWISQHEIKGINATSEMAHALLAAFKIYSGE